MGVCPLGRGLAWNLGEIQERNGQSETMTWRREGGHVVEGGPVVLDCRLRGQLWYQ